MFNAFRWIPTTLRRRHQARKTRAARLVLEPLEDRTVPTVTVGFDNGTLNVSSDADDSIVLSRDDFFLAVNGQTTTILAEAIENIFVNNQENDGPGDNLIDMRGVTQTTFQNLSLVNIRGRDGDDTVLLNHSVLPAISISYDGGSGTNQLITTVSSNGDNELRNAVGLANDTYLTVIQFAPALNGDTITLMSEIVVSDAVTVDARSLTDGITLDGGTGSNRLFSVSNGASLALRALTLSGGNGGGAAANGFGGAIYNAGTLFLTDCTIADNSATSDGGGILNTGTLTVSGSTISDNVADHKGGGVANQGTATFLNATLSGNRSQNAGGGLLGDNGSTSFLTNTTVTRNRSDSDDNGSGDGGGIDIFGATMRLNNTIVAGNFKGTGTTPADIGDGFVDRPNSFNNLIGDNGTGGAVENGVNGNIVGNNGSGTRAITTILDTTLADNGGPTRTHALVAGSPAINAGNDTRAVDAQNNALAFDQRGDGFPRFVGRVDIGAFEVQDSTPPDTSISAMPSLVSTKTTATFTFTGTDNFTTPANLTFEVKLDNGAAFTPISGSSFTTPTLDLGSHTLQVRARDEVGNVDASPASYTWTITSVSGPIVVDNAGDGVDGNIGTGQLTVREAVLLANDHTGADTIDFAASITAVTLTNGELRLTDAATTTIGGHGVTIARSTAAGTPEFRIVHVATGASAALSGLTLTNGQAFSGGGIYNDGTLTVTNSTLSANSASLGGGLFNFFGTLTVTNSTLSANSANFGGGIRNFGTLTVTNSTLTANAAAFSGGGIAAEGTETLNNTIVAGNFLPGNTPSDIAGSINTANNNLIGDANSSGGITHGSNRNIVGNNGSGTRAITTILDTTLADNDGPTHTHALVAGSPAINAGADALAVDAQGNALEFDQRGNGFPRIRGGTVDIGAFEIYVPLNANAGGPYQINEGQDLELDASASTSPFMATLMTFSWDINGDNEYGDATGSNPTVTWARLRELGIDDSGTRQVTVQVTDAGGAMDISDPVTLKIMNEAPTATLANSGPVTAGSTATVTNSNPSDPSSADTEAGFHYAYDFDNDGNFEVGDGTYAGSVTGASADVPAEFLANPGTTVRARIIDKDNAFTELTTDIEVGAESHFGSPIGIDVGGVRGQSLAGVIAAFIPAVGDVPEDFRVHIFWGDGTQSEADVTAFEDGFFGVVGQHVYAAAGEFAIQALITHSDDSNVQISSSAVVTVTSLDETTGRLLIGGTPGSDAILITPTATPGVVQVSIRGVVYGPFQAGAIAVYGYGGNDILKVGILKVGTTVFRVQVPTLLHGGAGNDKLDAQFNKGSTMLVGGAGNDTLTGSGVRDILIGGQGRDSLKGGEGEDILVGDVFVAEDDLDLSFIMLGEWARTDLKFKDRKALFEQVFNEQTLGSDAAGDTLTGGAGKDWFLRRRSSPADVVSDQLPGDIVTGLP